MFQRLPKLSTLWFVASLSLTLWFAFGRPTPEPQRATAATQAMPVTQPVSRVKPISEAQLGERAIGQNPLREQVDDDLEQPNEATWRKLTLRLPKDNGKWLTVELLRSLEWIEIEGAEVGGTLFLDLAEMGAFGDAEVLSIDSCPPIQPGHGNIITGRFLHEVEQGEVIELRFANQLEATRVTKNHPYWSMDRDDFIPAGELREGEQVDCLNGTGTTTVASIKPIDYSGPVYNLEIHSEHVYRVGSAGVLTHNSCLVSSRMHTLTLSTSGWRSTQFSQQGLVYILRDASTGELLKVGQTTAAKFVGRFEKYVAAANRTGRELMIDVFETPLHQRGAIEGEIRNNLGPAFQLLWDNTGRRLGRPGPGIPF